jgi:hypothetical protein
MTLTSTTKELRDAQAALTWVPDEDLAELDRLSRHGAAALSCFVGGAGQLYTANYLVGGLALAANVGFIVLGFVVGLPSWGWVPGVIGGIALAPRAHRDARAINRYVNAREAERRQSNSGPAPAVYRLLAAASSVDPKAVAEYGQLQAGVRAAAQAGAPSAAAAAPSHGAGPHGAVVAKLRQSAKLHASGMLDASEFADRKIALFSEVAPATRDELDDMLDALLPLFEEGVISHDDVAFLKTMGDHLI